MEDNWLLIVIMES
uniref:Uncharacterized protein n=1 Tax=Rhizophora mucronata TaxID=61149 RepID=A0A2P2MX77_RHIMU